MVLQPHGAGNAILLSDLRSASLYAHPPYKRDTVSVEGLTSASLELPTTESLAAN